MSRGAHTFKQGDVTRALKGAINAGLKVERVEIDSDGRIIVVSEKPTAVTARNEWDEV